jgi:hypothetical protein
MLSNLSLKRIKEMPGDRLTNYEIGATFEPELSLAIDRAVLQVEMGS